MFVLHVFGDVSVSGRYELTKPYINEFFLKLSDENKLQEVQDIAETFKLHLLRKVSMDFQGRLWDLIVSVPDHCLSL